MLANQWSNELAMERSVRYHYIHCSKCWQGVRVNGEIRVTTDLLYLFGVVDFGRTLDLRCR